jgi:hypothetical protein
MKSWKFIGVIAIVAIGLIFEFSKTSSPVANKSADLNKIIADAEHEPFVQTNTEDTVPPVDTPERTRRNGRNTPTSLETAHPQNNYASADNGGSMSFGRPPMGSEEDADIKEEDEESLEEDDLVADDNPCDEDDVECLEAIARKQAEERQKAAETEQAKEDAETNDEQDSENEDEEQNIAEQAPVTGPGGQVGPQTPEEPQQPEGELIVYWVNMLSRAPDYKLANEFAGLQQSKQISTNVYYSVVDELLLDPREPIQIVAVYLLASFQSADSFEKLVGIADEAIFGSRLNKQTETYLNAYKKVNNLRHLRAVLSSSANVQVLQKAIRLVESAAQKRLNDGIRTASEGGEEVSTLSANDASVFRGFVSVLEELVQSVGDSETISLATNALDQLQQILPAEAEDNETVAANQ